MEGGEKREVKRDGGERQWRGCKYIKNLKLLNIRRTCIRSDLSYKVQTVK